MMMVMLIKINAEAALGCVSRRLCIDAAI